MLDNGGTAGDGTGDNLGIIHKGWLQRRVTVDNASRTATSDAGELMRWSNVRFFHVYVDSPLTFAGSGAAEVLTVSTSLAPEHRYATTVDAAMGAGDDAVRYATGPMSGTLATGARATTPVEMPHCSTIEYRLGRWFRCGDTTADGGRFSFLTEVGRFEGRALVTAGRRADIVGTQGRDAIVVRAPRIFVDARGGDDRVTVSPYATDEGLDPARRERRRHPARGEARRSARGRCGTRPPGRSRDDDVLIGGRGRDTARGGSGNDRCSAEVARRCEVQRT